MQLSFLGGTDTVTGSKYFVTTDGARVLVDCGLFQGLKHLRLRNWAPPPVDPSSLDAIVLTHAHLDHSGYLPVMVREGFRGPIYCTQGTRDLLGILLRDAAHLQEQDARFANRKGFSKHRPALPLYTVEDAERTLPLVRAVGTGRPLGVGDATVSFTPVGHILGAAAVTIRDRHTVLTFSGDVGRADDRLMMPPMTVPPSDWLVVESTYGDRLHPTSDPLEDLASVISRVAARRGVVMVPAFAVGRAQLLLHLIAELKAAGRIPDIDTYLDSPMAIDATEIFCKHNSHRLDSGQCRAMCQTARFVRDPEESKALDRREGPMIVIAGSGMATGGRILHHLKVWGPDPKNAVLLVGYQAAGTRGAALVGGAEAVKIHGAYVPIRAERVVMHGLSAHADWRGLVDWLRPLAAPQRVFVTHGEPAAADALRLRLTETLGFTAEVPEHGSTVDLVAERLAVAQ